MHVSRHGGGSSFHRESDVSNTNVRISREQFQKVLILFRFQNDENEGCEDSQSGRFQGKLLLKLSYGVDVLRPSDARQPLITILPFPHLQTPVWWGSSDAEQARGRR